MELERIRIFLAAAEAGSFSEAARRLYISHSTTSRAVSALEDEIGVTLIDREDNRITGLTAAGRLLYEKGGELLRMEEGLRRECAALGAKEK
jgi:DNA-binding transcriptional LysR family regulator